MAPVCIPDMRSGIKLFFRPHVNKHMVVIIMLLFCDTTIGDEDEINFIKMAAIGLIDPYDKSVELED